MGLHHGIVDGVYWSHHDDKVSDEEWARYVDTTRAALEPLRGSGKRLSILTLAQRVEPPNAKQRRALADVIQSDLAQHVVRHAFLSDSVMLRGVLTALDWLVTKPYAERTFSDPMLALDWLHEAQAFDRQAVIGAIRGTVPAAVLHTGLRGR
jgi:hypothetical protein